MTQKTYNSITVFVFAVVGILHALRILNDWPAYVGGWVVPMWVSWVAVIIAVVLAWKGSKQTKR